MKRLEFLLHFIPALLSVLSSGTRVTVQIIPLKRFMNFSRQELMSFVTLMSKSTYKKDAALLLGSIFCFIVII